MIIPIENPTIKNGRCLEISQHWDENKDYYLKNFGIAGHNGLDFAYLNPLGLPAHDSPSYGRPILAPCDMKIKKVIFLGERNTKGNGIYAVGKGCELIFWHNRANCVKVGQDVARGEKIAEMGNSGLVWPVPDQNDPMDKSGTHLHFALRPLNEDNSIKYPNNGFDGFVDPLPYLELNEKTMLDLYGNSQTKEQYMKDNEGVLHRILNEETLKDFHEAGIINKEAIVWLTVNQFSVYKIGNVWLSVSDQ